MIRADLKRVATAMHQLGAIRLGLTLLFVLLAIIIARFSWHMPILLLDAEHALFDARASLTAPKTDQDDRIVIIAYTDDTLMATGKRSPLDRTILSKALKRIDNFGAKAIGIDILIDQPQPEDPAIIAAFRTMKTPTFLAYASARSAEDKMLLWQQQFLEGFLAQLTPGNVHPASIVIHADDDNVLRRWAEITPQSPSRIPNAMIPQARDFADYRGSVAYRLPAFEGTPVFTTIPIDSFAEDALFANPEAAALFRKQIEGRYVLIGGNIQDIDLFETPMTRLNGKPMWGVEIFAHMLAQQLDHRRLQPITPPMLWTLAALIALLGALTAMSNARPIVVASAALVQIAALAGVPFWFHIRNWDSYGLPAFGWLVGWFLAFAAVGTAARAIGSEQRKFAQSALGKYLPVDIAAQIIRNPESLSLTGEKREIFVVFTDLEGFTKLSHAIAPEMVATLLNRYLDMLSDVVLQHGGTIDKFVGDAVVAFWGAPISRPDDGERATRAAIAMHAAGEHFRHTVPEGVPPIGKTRVGLHYGDAIVGNFGGEGRIQYTALGDSMNTASRLESANKQTKSNILISREAATLSGLDIFRSLGRVVLRGRATPIEIFEPATDLDAEARKRYAEIAARAIAGDVSAITELAELSAINPDDTALANFVYRLEHQEDGGYFVLD